jgi:hypothetical protein
VTFLNVFFSPGASFRKIKEKPSWIVPMIIVIVFSMAIAMIGASKMDRTAIRDRVTEQMRQQGVSEDQIQQRLEQFDKMGSNPVMKFVFPAISVLMITIIGLLLSAVVLNWIVPMTGAAQANFLLTFSVVSWAAVVRVLGSLVKGVLIYLRGPMNVSTGLLLLAPNLKPGYLYALLNGIDLFSIWEVILVAMGLKIAYDLKGKSVYFYVLLLWILAVAALSLFALMPGARPA